MSFSAQHFCDTCGAANREQALFCRVCGNSLQIEGHTVSPSTTTSQPVRTGALQAQSLLNQRYTILAQAGQGGFGAVYKAMDTKFGNRLVAIKEMSQSTIDPAELPSATNAFYHEARLLASLMHPNLPCIYEQFSEQGRAYLVMDFIEGQTLEQRLKQAPGHKLPLTEVLPLGLQICAVLDYLHSQKPPIIFRDLKPANIMLTGNGHVFLIDFGIARHFKPGQKKDTTALGSSGYAPPEQYGRSQTTERADIYSLGATLHEALSGDDPSETPFRFLPVPTNNDPILTDLNTLIMNMVSVEINRRPASIALVRQELQKIFTRYTQQHPNVIEQSWSGTLPISLPPVTISVPAAAGAAAPSLPAAEATTIQTATRKRSDKTNTTGRPQVYPQANTLHICQGHSKRITAVNWSPDGQRIASASYDKTVRVWDASNGQHIATYFGHSERVNDIAWSQDNTLIISVSDDQTAQIWEAGSGKQLFVYRGHSGPVNTVAWSHDGTMIATGGDDKKIQIWSADNKELLTTYTDHTDSVLCLSWSPRAHLLASGGKDNKLIVNEFEKTQQKSLLRRLFTPHYGQKQFTDHNGPITDIDWSPDGRSLVTTSGDYRVRIRSIRNAATSFIGEGKGTIKNSVAWSPGGHYLAIGGNDKVVRIWNVNSNKETFVYYGHAGYVVAAAWSPRGDRIASAGVDRTVQVWQAI